MHLLTGSVHILASSACSASSSIMLVITFIFCEAHLRSALATALKDPDPDVVEAAAEALAMVKDPGSTPALIEALDFPLTEDGTKRELLRALGQSGGTQAADAIVPSPNSMDD